MAEVFDHNVTLFVLVVHGVDSQPARIFGRTKSGLMFIGNNSGYFNWLIEDFGLEYLYKNNTTRMVNGHSFGGKYVQIPTAAHIIANQPLENIGTRVTENFLENFKIQDGTVVHIDNFGLIKIKSPNLKNLVHGQKLRLFVNGNEAEELIFSEKMKQEKTGEKVLFTGSSLAGLPEIAVVRAENSANLLGIKLGDIVSWQAIQ
jgi:S-adenosylmethionine hydrolase